MLDGFGIPRNCCPLCGGKIIVSALHQYSKEYAVTQKGTISKKFKYHDDGPDGGAIAFCENVNDGCVAWWGNGEFYIQDEKFFDTKYDETEEVNEK